MFHVVFEIFDSLMVSIFIPQKLLHDFNCFSIKSMLTVSSSSRHFQCDHDIKPFKKFHYKKMQRTIIQTVFQNSFSFPDSCVVGHTHVVLTTGKNGKTDWSMRSLLYFWPCLEPSVPVDISHMQRHKSMRIMAPLQLK